MRGSNLKVLTVETELVPANGEKIAPEASDKFVFTPQVQEVTERAMAYLGVGYSVHFAGAAGTGKTTLAFHAAAKLGAC